ncbi:MAG: type II toxin-antitoxin system RelE/ParE family toxin [Candidatus Bathyarchaeia archaeon]
MTTSNRTTFNVLIHKKALKEIDGLPIDNKKRILSSLRDMAKDPFSGDVKPIKGVRSLLRRRVGDYRISFTVNFEKSEVVVLKVGRRESFY